MDSSTNYAFNDDITEEIENKASLGVVDEDTEGYFAPAMYQKKKASIVSFKSGDERRRSSVKPQFRTGDSASASQHVSFNGSGKNSMNPRLSIDESEDSYLAPIRRPSRKNTSRKSTDSGYNRRSSIIAQLGTLSMVSRKLSVAGPSMGAINASFVGTQRRKSVKSVVDEANQVATIQAVEQVILYFRFL